MNAVEDALIRRLDARRAIAKALGRQSERNQAILVDAWRSGWTYREIGDRLGLSTTRIMQICERGFRDAQRALTEKRRPEAARHRSRASAPVCRALPPAFDKAAFLEHMQRLIALRDYERETERLRREADRVAAKERQWQRELRAMAHFVEMATPPPPRRPPPPAPASQPSPWPLPPVSLPVQYTVSAPLRPPPLPMPAADLAQEALLSFMYYRMPTENGRDEVGEQCSTVVFSMPGHPLAQHIDEGMRRLAAEVPHDAVLSARPISSDVPPNLVTTSNAHVAVQAIVLSHNAYSGIATYRLAVTWDYAPDGTA